MPLQSSDSEQLSRPPTVILADQIAKDLGIISAGERSFTLARPASDSQKGSQLIRDTTRLMQGPAHVGRKYWVILFMFGLVGAALFTVDAVMSLPSQVHSITQAVGEALVVAVVVSLVVEPRLLRYFGEELSSQTFWASFYSRAPEAYREAIKELAGKTDFAHAFNFVLSFDWADREKTVVKMTGEWTEHRENRSPRQLPLEINAFVPESCFPDFKAEFPSCVIVCQELAFYANLIDAGVLKVIQGNDGRLTMVQDENMAPLFMVPPNARYTKITSAVTYFGPIGFMAYVSVGPTLQFGIQLRGTALADLYFSILHPGQGVTPVFEGIGTDLAARGLLRIGEVFIEGQSVVLSWKQKEPPAGEQSKAVEVAI